jgi:hypothetical protein
MSIKYIWKPDTWLEHFAMRLPWTDGVNNITIDKSPSYFNVLEFPNITKIAKQLLPNAKIAVSVCNPSLRLFSEYNVRTIEPKDTDSTSALIMVFFMKKDSVLTSDLLSVSLFAQHNMDQIQEKFLQFYKNNHIPPPMNFSSFVELLFASSYDPNPDICHKFPKFCVNNAVPPGFFDRNRMFYLKKGEYSTNLKAWRDAFGAENVLVVDMNEDQKDVAHQLLKLVGHDILPPEEYPWDEVGEEVDFKSTAANYTGRDAAYLDFPQEIAMLERYYARYNEELSQLIGKDYPLEWNSKSSGLLEAS